MLRRSREDACMTAKLTRRAALAALPAGLLAATSRQPAHALQADVLRFGLGATVTSLDPQYHQLGTNIQAGLNFFDVLVAAGRDGRLIPALAESWSATDDHTWEFRLRRGVTFTDGSEFGAPDVIATIARAPNVANSPGPFLLVPRSIASMDAPDPLTLRIRTTAPMPIFPEMLYNIMIIHRSAQQASTADFNSGRALIGTGPFRLAEYVPGDHIRMTRNDAHWRGPAPWREVQMPLLLNAAARTAALRSGGVDLIEDVPVADADDLAHRAGITVTQLVSDRQVHLGINYRAQPRFITARDGSPLSTNPLRDLRVRQALSRAINRQALVERVMQGHATAAGQFLPDGFATAAPNLPPDPYDPAGARALLAEAGFPEGFAITVQGPNDRYVNDSQALQAVAQMWQRVGIATKVDVMPYSVFAPRANHGEYDCFLSSWGALAGWSFLTRLLLPPDPARGWGVGNHGYDNPEVTRLTETAMATFDTDARDRLIQQATVLAMHDVAHIPLHYEKGLWASGERIAFAAPTTQYTLPYEVKQKA
jgi:peptide/nickel transport system substrate-binding protein